MILRVHFNQFGQPWTPAFAGMTNEFEKDRGMELLSRVHFSPSRGIWGWPLTLWEIKEGLGKEGFSSII